MPRLGPEDGFSLVEVLIVTALVVTGVATMARVVTIAIDLNADSRATSLATQLAADKVEALRALAWPDLTAVGCDAAALASRAAGCVDYLDAAGAPLGAPSAAVPAGAVYVRQWSVRPIAGADETLAVEVLVTRWPAARHAGVVRVASARVHWRP